MDANEFYGGFPMKVTYENYRLDPKDIQKSITNSIIHTPTNFASALMSVEPESYQGPQMNQLELAHK